MAILWQSHAFGTKQPNSINAIEPCIPANGFGWLD